MSCQTAVLLYSFSLLLAAVAGAACLLGSLWAFVVDDFSFLQLGYIRDPRQSRSLLVQDESLFYPNLIVFSLPPCASQYAEPPQPSLSFSFVFRVGTSASTALFAVLSIELDSHANAPQYDIMIFSLHVCKTVSLKETLRRTPISSKRNINQVFPIIMILEEKLEN